MELLISQLILSGKTSGQFRVVGDDDQNRFLALLQFNQQRSDCVG